VVVRSAKLTKNGVSEGSEQLMPREVEQAKGARREKAVLVSCHHAHCMEEEDNHMNEPTKNSTSGVRKTHEPTMVVLHP
jgi:hypothetical protein